MRIWTLPDLRRVNTFTAAEHGYAYSEDAWGRDRACSLHNLPWLWIIYAQRLCWTYGEAEALRRLNTQQTARAA